MRTSGTKILVMVVFLLTLGAGVVAGLLASRLPAVSVKPDSTPAVNDSLAAELSLTADQREKMKEIWVGVQAITQESLEQSLKAESDRNRAIDALIPPDKIDAYNAIKRNYAETNAKLKGRRDAAFDKAVTETSEKILTSEQREKYLKILKKRLGADINAGHDSPEKSLLSAPLDGPARESIPGT